MPTLVTLVQSLVGVALILDGLGLGMRFSPERIWDTLRHPLALTRTVGVSVLLVPALAWAVTRGLRIDPAFAAGILLAAIGSATPDALRFVVPGAGRLPYAVALLVVLNLLNVVMIPAWAFLMFPVAVAFDPTVILRLLLVSLLLPYGAGVLVRHVAPDRARAWSPVLHRIGSSTLILVGVTVLLLLLPMIWPIIGSTAMAASVIITAAGLGCGYLAGGRSGEVRRTSALLTAARAYMPALLMAVTTAPGNRSVLGGVVAMLLAGVVVRLPVLIVWRRRHGAETIDFDQSRRDAA